MAVDPRLAPLIGTWRGGGQGTFPGFGSFEFDEEVAFTSAGDDLAYLQQAWARHTGDTLHAEAGMWRLNEEVGLIVTVALPRVVEVSLGTATGDRWQVTSSQVARAPGGARLVASARRYWLVDEELHYEVDLAAGAMSAPEHHLSGRLRRVEGPG
jgi:hypothetical protein